MTGDDLCRLLDTLNPANEPGRITLLRFGAPKIEQHCLLIRTVKTHGYDVLWSCDPMHGNTSTTDSGYKTRDLPLSFQSLNLWIFTRQKEQSPEVFILN